MARWIVAGVLLAALIALIVVDPTSLESGVASAPGNAPVAAGEPGAAAAPAGDAAASTAGEPATDPTLTKVDERPKLGESCAKVKEAVQAAKGEKYMVALGDAILAKTTEDAFAAACAEVAALPVDQQVAKLEALAGGPPPVE